MRTVCTDLSGLLVVLVEEGLPPVLDARLDVLCRGEARPVPGERPCRGQPHLAAWGATFENAKNGKKWKRLWIKI